MNITELARQIKIPTAELREIIPQLGFDIGKKAIQVDNRIAQKIINKLNSPETRKKILGKTESKSIPQPVPADTKKTDKTKKRAIEISETIRVKELARQMGIETTKLILELMKNGIMASLTQSIDYESAAIIAEDLGFKVKKIDTSSGKKINLKEENRLRQELFSDEPEKLQPRPPVITIMGHVDHGKTKLLDAIRETDVATGEAGGITQHIGAYQVKKNNQLLTFIDTPGHKAFSAMRSRGAQVADIVILVIAADDGIQPQTIESISYIQAANLPFIVAINKIDKPGANVDKIKSELAELKLTPEDWGGKTICVEISAKQKINIDGLLDTLLLVYEMEKDKIQANPQRKAVGTIIESHLDKSEGPVATVLIQTGTLRKADVVKIGNVLGKIKIMRDWQGHQVEQAPPSMPVRIIGLKSVPEVGEILQVMADTKTAKKELRKYKTYKPIHSANKNSVQSQTSENEKAEIKKINIILKTDVLGSQEAVLDTLNNLQQPDLILNVVRCSLGNITEVDVERAEKQNALLIGFNVEVVSQAKQIAKDKNIKIKTSKIIYELLDYLKSEMNKILESEIRTEIIGKVKILKIFRTEKNSQIVGGKVLEGKIEADRHNLGEEQTDAVQIKLNIYRNDKFVGQADLIELQSAKQAVTEVVEGQEAGIKIENFNETQEGDIIEVVKKEEIKRKI